MANKKILLHCFLLLFLCVIGGGILITVANYLPINENTKKTTLEYIQEEGLFPEVPSMQGGYGSFQSMNPTALELATVGLMLKMALYEGDGEGITQAFRCYSTQVESEYSRYWHGYVVILRVLLYFFDYYELRIINGLCQTFLLVMAAVSIFRRKGWKYALALVTSYVLLMPLALAQCLQYSWVFYVALGALLIYLKFQTYWETGNRYLCLFMLVGAATIYLDLLTYSLLTWGLLIIWWILLQDKNGGNWEDNGILSYLKKVVCSGVFWIIGYGGMWIGKLALGSVILRENLFEKAVSEALLWTVNEGEASITLQDRLNAVYLNWNTYQYKLYFILLLIWLVYWVLRGVLTGYEKSAKLPALLLIACSSIVWYTVLAGHTTMHHIFTHRIYAVSIAAFLGMILLSTEGKAAHGTEKTRLIPRAAFLAGTGILSFVLMLQIRDEYYLHNGTHEFQKVEMTAPVSMLFTPSYSDVISLTLGLSFENGSEGLIKITLWDQNTLAEQMTFPIASYYEGNFHSIDVEWELKKGNSYLLSLEPVGNDGQVYLWVTNDGQMPLSEYGSITMGNQQVSGQLLSGICYWCMLVGRSRHLFFTATFMGVFLMLFLSLQSALETYGSAFPRTGILRSSEGKR